MEQHTLFKTATGATYAVSPRVIANGYRPKDGTRIATAQERDDFFESLERGVELSERNMDEVAGELRAQGLPDEVVEHMTGVVLSEDS